MESLIRRQSMMYGPKPVQYDGIPLMITNVGDEPIEVSLNFNALRKTEPPIIYYNTTGKKAYKKWDLSNITLAKGGTLYLFGENSAVDSTFVVNGNSSIHVDGKLEALLQGQVGTAQFGDYALEGLFKDVTQLESVGDIMPQIIGGVNAPSVYSTGYRYSSLFENTGIVEIPNNFLKETTISSPHSRLYNRMFFGCTKLTTIPRDLFINQNGGSGSIGATYYSMFQDCSNLEVAADLYIQTQGFQSAYSMYRGCKKITDVKVFTKTLANNHSMQYFVSGCDNLQSIDFDIDRVTHWGVLSNAMLNCKNLTKVSIKVKTWDHEQTITQNGAYSNWMQGVSPTGTFTCTKELADETDGYYDEEGNFVKGVGRGNSSVPAGWYIDYPIIDARDGDANAMALMAVISQQVHADGTPWVKDSLVMMKSEAEKVDDIGTFFKGNRSITDFAALSFFSITSFAQTALESCANITKLHLPITTESIGYRAFRATAITSLYIPDNVAFIDEGIIAHCKNVTSLAVSPNNTKYYSGEYNAIIEKDTHKFIMGCNTSTIPSDTKVIGKGAFNGIPITQVMLPEGLEEIETMAFAEYQGGELIIPSSVNIIGSQVFYATKLTSLTLPDGLVKMESNLVSNSANLTSITIPASVTSIGNGCMSNCKKLTTINFGGTMSQWNSMEKKQNWNNNVPTDCVIYCTDGNLNITEST